MTAPNVAEAVAALPPDLAGRVCAAVAAHPATAPLFLDLLAHLSPPHSAKKRKTALGPLSASLPCVATISNASLPCVATISNISLLIPQRKKVSLSIHQSELMVVLDGSVLSRMRFGDIQVLFFAETPGKTKPHTSLLVIPNKETGNVSDKVLLMCWDHSGIHYGSGLDSETLKKSNSSTLIKKRETLENSIDDKETFKNSIKDKETKDKKSSTLSNSKLMDILTHTLKSSPYSPLILSAPPKSSIDCHFKAKDGALFLLPQALIFGIQKKPVFYFPAGSFELGISGVTGRTFNVVVRVKDIDSIDAGQEFEFGMVDAGMYGRVASYIETMSCTTSKKDEHATKEDGNEIETIGIPEEESDDEDYESGAESVEMEEFDSDTQSESDGASVSIKSNESVSQDEEEGDEQEGADDIIGLGDEQEIDGAGLEGDEQEIDDGALMEDEDNGQDESGGLGEESGQTGMTGIEESGQMQSIEVHLVSDGDDELDELE